MTTATALLMALQQRNDEVRLRQGAEAQAEKLRVQLAEAQRLLGWVSYRSNKGCNSFRRRARDAALSDVAHHTQHFAKHWDGVPSKPDPLKMWMGESP